MRWTRAHQARERDGRAGAKACERSNGARTNDVAGGRRSRVVLTPRRWRQGGGRHLCPTGLLEVLHSAGDGGKQARSPGRARRKPLKPLRAGTPGEPVYLRSILVCFLPFAHEAMGAAGTRRSPRPLILLGERFVAELGRMASRECGGVSGYNVIARSPCDEAIRFLRGYGLLRYARNDDLHSSSRLKAGTHNPWR